MGAASCHLSTYTQPLLPAARQHDPCHKDILLLPNTLWLLWKGGGRKRTHPEASFHFKDTLGPCHSKTINREEHKTGGQVGWLGKHCRACKLGLLASWTRPATRPVLLPSALAPVGDILGHVLWPDCQ